jgi:hypothetical protein
MLRGSLLLITIALVACGKPLRVVDIDPAFQPYVDSFLSDAHEHSREAVVNNLIMRFAPNIDGTQTAFCDMTEMVPTITIERTYWDMSPEVIKKALIYHELGHCVLHQPHRDAYVSPYLPMSIMNTWMVEDYYLEVYWDNYVNELFTGRWE